MCIWPFRNFIDTYQSKEFFYQNSNQKSNMFEPKCILGDSKQLTLFILIYLSVLATTYLSVYLSLSICPSLYIFL